MYLSTKSFIFYLVFVYAIFPSNVAIAAKAVIPCFANAGTLNTNSTDVCAGGDLEVSTVGEQLGYNHYFFLYTQDEFGNTTFEEARAAIAGNAAATFTGLAVGDYLVCTYSESPLSPPNPSPITVIPALDDINDTGNIFAGCFDTACTQFSVANTLTVSLDGDQIDEDNSTGNNVLTAEVCGGTPPYEVDLDTSGGFVSIKEYPSENEGCVNFQVVYTDEANWTATITDGGNCKSNTTTFGSQGIATLSLPQIVELDIAPESCPGKADGNIHIEVEGGDDSCGEYTYDWAGPDGFTATIVDGTTGSDLLDLASGTYSVTVTDCAGTYTIQEMHVSRSNIGGRGGRGRGGCKTFEQDHFHQNENLQVSPNPFHSSTTIQFSLSQTSNVWLAAYSMDGRKVATLLEGATTEADILQRMDFENRGLEAGIYVLELKTNTGLHQIQRLVVVN